MKRFLALLLCAACLCSYAAFAAADAGTAKIGSGSANTVTVSMRSGVTADVLLAQGSISKDQAASEIIRSASGSGTLIVAVNGCFFNTYGGQSEDGYGNAARSQRDLVKDGRVINGGGGDQTAIYLGFTRDGRALIDEVGITLYVEHSGKRYPTWGVNYYYPDEPNSLLLFTPEAGVDLPVPANAKVAKIVGGRVTGILESGKCVCAPDTYYFVCGKNLYDRLPPVGAAVSFSTEFDKSAWSDVVTAVSCGPWLLHNGANVFSENAKYSYLADQKMSETAVLQRTFAAILSNGDLMLGTCSASPKQITDYLLSIGAKDAMLLDGGASSMLYANGKTLTSAGRKLNNVIVIYDGTQNTPDTPAAPANTAYASTQTVELDGKKVEFQMYALVDANGGQTNYIKIRDLALALNGTKARFSVEWDGQVNLVTGSAYTPNGSENSTPFKGDRAYTVPTSPTNVNGEPSDLAAITLTDGNGGGYNYYKLRDLGSKLGFNVGWTAERGVYIESDQPYSG